MYFVEMKLEKVNTFKKNAEYWYSIVNIGVVSYHNIVLRHMYHDNIVSCRVW